MTQLCGVENNSSLTCDDFEAVANDNQTATSVLPCMTLLQVEAKTLVSVVLAIGTYSIAMAMRAAKSSGFYNASVRKAMGDFGVAFAIFCMVRYPGGCSSCGLGSSRAAGCRSSSTSSSSPRMLTCSMCPRPLSGQTVNLVRSVRHSCLLTRVLTRSRHVRVHRSRWASRLGNRVVDHPRHSGDAAGLAGQQHYLPYAGTPSLPRVPACPNFNSLRAGIVNSPDHKLTKGTAYHWDTMVTGVFIAITSLFGLPWLVAATVRSLLLCKSLATTANVNGKDRIVHVNDNRFTGFAIHCLLLGAVFLPNLLKKIPIPVIFGLFLCACLAICGPRPYTHTDRIGPVSSAWTHYQRATLSAQTWASRRWLATRSLSASSSWRSGRVRNFD